MSVLERVRASERFDAGAQGAEDERVRALKRDVKRQMLERVGFAEVARMANAPDAQRSREELRPAIEAVINAGDREGIGADTRTRIVDEVLNDVVGLGPLQPLLEDDTVSEIMVNGCSSAFFERAGVLHPLEGIFDNDEQIRIVVDRIISPLGRRVDERSPIVNARLPSGYRVNAVIPPIAIDGTTLTIRKFSDRISSLAQLVAMGSLPAWYAGMLSCAVALRQDLAVAGGTGSGKTTLLNALSCEIPLGERIVTIEDSAELKFSRHPHVVRLEAREPSIEGEGAVTIRDLVTNALRMRPDRIVVGEVRGAECIDMLQAMNTGHDGSLTTLHAGSSREAIVRLTLLARYGIDLPGDLIEEQIAMALDAIVMSVRTPDGHRYVSSYTGVARGAAGGVELTEYVSFDAATRTWDLIEEPPFIAEGLRSGALREKEVERWRSLCPAASGSLRHCA
ncbi:CpaF family protein [Collinsella tanakaei]|uniref:CpaF family protein n=1 Tax=Collinsella tanakaei TaxID=626935 RepID=UPI0025A387EB|nr:CpaF family protein [Collinsella tanakaei]MDM8300468.1 CpaF family protein [Collinsella tanakaei]